MRDGQERTGKRGDPFRTTDGSTTGRERDREHGRTGMKFRLNRQLVSVVTTVALLLAVVATVALFRGRAPSAVPAAPSGGAAASQGDYRLSPPNEAESSDTSVGVTFPAGNEPALTESREDHRADAPAAPAAPARDYTSDLGTDYDPFVIGSSQRRYPSAASAPVANCAEVYQRNDQQYPDCAASAVPGRVEDRPGQPAVPTDPGVGPSEFLPGDTGPSPLPSATPDASGDPGPACRLLAGCDR